MGEITGGRLIGKALKAEGVKYIFTLNGGHIYNIFEGCEEEGIKIIAVRRGLPEGMGFRRAATVTAALGTVVLTVLKTAAQCRIGKGR